MTHLVEYVAVGVLGGLIIRGIRGLIYARGTYRRGEHQ